MISVLDFGSSGLGSNPGWVHRFVFLGKPLNTHSASLHPDVKMGTGKFDSRGNSAMKWHPIQGGVEILLVTSCYENWRL